MLLTATLKSQVRQIRNYTELVIKTNITNISIIIKFFYLTLYKVHCALHFFGIEIMSLILMAGKSHKLLKLFYFLISIMAYIDYINQRHEGFC